MSRTPVSAEHPSSSAPARRPRRRRGTGAIALEFLGSMNLAVTVFVAICIAAVIGTVLQQNEPYQGYLIKFGPFWFEVFRAAGLYDIYGTIWFWLLLGFLLVSTSVCVYRNGPKMLREMVQFRENVTRSSLRGFHNKKEWATPGEPEAIADAAGGYLRQQGLRVRRKDHGDHIVLAAVKGGVNRMGYLATHLAIVVICIGALVDANLPLKIAQRTGEVRIETRTEIPVSEVPENSILGPENSAFRGSVNVPEGSSATVVFLNVRDGYLVQRLPFRIELKDFRIEHYRSGQPKSFESDLVIHDPERDEPLERTISVNHPLIYKGYAIYQASFSDGGSRLDMRLWPLRAHEQKSLELSGTVGSNVSVQNADQTLTLELDDFRLFNINPVDTENSDREFRNFGPSFSFKVRDPSGQAREHNNFMAPVEIEGRTYYVSGVRTTPAEQFEYLRIPADPNGGLERFMRFRARLLDSAQRRAAAEETADNLLSAVQRGKADLQGNLVQTIERLLALFAQSGFAGLSEHLEEQVPEDQRQAVAEAYYRMLRGALGTLYIETLHQEGADVSSEVSEADTRFFDDAISAMAQLDDYGAPFYVQLADFEHRQASGLQITRSPGKKAVYFGCVLLIAGVFMLFYISHRRYWVWVEPEEGASLVILAGTARRNPRDFAREFEEKAAGLARMLHQYPG